MKKIIGLLLVCMIVFGGLSSCVAESVEYMSRALVVNELKKYVDEHLSVFIEKAKNTGTLSDVDATLLVEYYCASVTLTNASMAEMNGIASEELTATTDAIIKGNALTTESIVELKNQYISGEATWDDSMAKVVRIIDAMLTTSAAAIADAAN